MDPLSIVGFASSILSVVNIVRKVFFETFKATRFIMKRYGIVGVWIILFGSDSVLRSELQVLASLDEKVASDFKKATQDESNMIAVAGAIVAQIAITALSLVDLSQTHWSARGLFTFSLVSSIIAVYYASRQHRIMGRCLNARQVKAWIENNDDLRPFAVLVLLFGDERSSQLPRLKKPAASSILTISAPIMLLSTSLNCFLGGFGVYLGLTWTKELDEDANSSDSRNVFLTYIIGLGVCYGIYTFSVLSQGGQRGDELSLEELLCKANEDQPASLLADEPRVSTYAHQPPHSRQTAEHIGMTPLAASDAQSTLIQRLLEAARLRQESAVVDTQLANLLADLAQQVRMDSREGRRRRHGHQSPEGESSSRHGPRSRY
ncbi:hypothetical protein B0H66DRAFT_485609 [Apodospora peruviana]|uniref:Uncharacterized protein n=1 Tax=Apodospora peruviana TaxID=516989 RepID=A0AAE0LZ82_9PEZI|nr:hypothetical protein B0H66DRAFT_485609 [Apodospora peruviana]